RSLGHDNPDDQFASAFAVGDFDGDGYMDLAVGVPGNNPSGAVFLWKGTGGPVEGSTGRLVAWKILLPSDVPPIVQPLVSSGRFRSALAAGDFNGDGRTDLAIGAPGTGAEDGTVFVSLQEQPTSRSPRRSLEFGFATNQLLLLRHFGAAGDAFGHALAVGDFD